MGTRPLVFVVLAAVASMGATYRTTNFTVEAPNAQVAQQAGQYAEYYRKQKAVQWLGQEMPNWSEPCPLQVTVTMSGAGGATSFAFDRGRVLGQHMHIEGSYERLMNSVLPHEVTHTVFAYRFRQPVPRWADEGGAVLSEDDVERNRHDQLCRQILNTPGRAIPLRRLFALKDYPSDVMALYAQGYSVTNFLVESSNRQVFLDFVAVGMRDGWDRAAQGYYHCNSVEELEQAWLNHLKETKRQPAAQLASSARPAAQEAPRGLLVRQTAPPAQPFEDSARPVYRGQAADDWNQAPRRAEASGRPTFIPDTSMSNPAPMNDRWQPVNGQAPGGQVRLGAPDFNAPPPQAQLGAPVPGPGYPQ